MHKYSISVVSYLNSKVFVKGLQKFKFSTEPTIELDIPSVCAQKLIHKKVDIGLIPLATLPKIPNANIISNYCISADGAVDSVFLFSNNPIQEIHTIYLDNHSNTSNNLCAILAKNYWKIQPEFVAREHDLVDLKPSEGFVLIGDRCFEVKDQYKYAYDLSNEWKKFTSLPFVFAVWVSNTNIEDAFLKEFNDALSLGFTMLNEVIEENAYLKANVEDYLKNKIQYELTDSKNSSIELFLNYLSRL